jgi:alginate production protein
MFFGIHSSGSLTSAIDYWLEGALVRGESQGTNIRGYGFDLGGTYRWAMRLQPSLTLNLAFGSGDGDPTDSVDHNFRQTGVQQNEARFSGITRLKYYGETLDPELSNLQIITLGVGIRPTPESSIELVYHDYRQDEALDELRDAKIEVEPSGNDREIGQAIDLVMGFEEIEDLELELVLGGFFPGRAFSTDADAAYFAGIEIIYGF